MQAGHRGVSLARTRITTPLAISSTPSRIRCSGAGKELLTISIDCPMKPTYQPCQVAPRVRKNPKILDLRAARQLRSGAVSIFAPFRPAQRILQSGDLLPETRIALCAFRPVVERHYLAAPVSPHRYRWRDRPYLCPLPFAWDRIHAANQGSARPITI